MNATSQTQSTVILLVRHGQTPTTGKVLPGRAPGLFLSEQGRQQAAKVADRLAELPIAGIYASPLERTMETATPTAQAHRLPIVEEPGLLEGDFGDWTGAELIELMKLPEWQTVQQRPDEFRFPHGESFVDIRDRMATTLDDLRNKHLGDTIVCFSHADPIRVAVADALGTPLRQFQRISIAPCSVSVIAYPEGASQSQPRVLTVNSTLESLSSLRAA